MRPWANYRQFQLLFGDVKMGLNPRFGVVLRCLDEIALGIRKFAAWHFSGNLLHVECKEAQQPSELRLVGSAVASVLGHRSIRANRTENKKSKYQPCHVVVLCGPQTVMLHAVF